MTWRSNKKGKLQTKVGCGRWTKGGNNWRVVWSFPLVLLSKGTFLRKCTKKGINIIYSSHVWQNNLYNQQLQRIIYLLGRPEHCSDNQQWPWDHAFTPSCTKGNTFLELVAQCQKLQHPPQTTKYLNKETV